MESRSYERGQHLDRSHERVYDNSSDDPVGTSGSVLITLVHVLKDRGQQRNIVNEYGSDSSSDDPKGTSEKVKMKMKMKKKMKVNSKMNMKLKTAQKMKKKLKFTIFCKLIIVLYGWLLKHG